MKKIGLFLIIASLTYAGRLGIGIAGGTQYPENYETIVAERFQNLYRGAEFYIQAEALPHVFLEPSIAYLNNPSLSSSSVGFGLGVNVRPRLGGFFIAPSFGIKGTLLLSNEIDISEAIRTGQLGAYIESSSLHATYAAFAGMSIFFSDKVSLDCQYRYLGLIQEYGVEMVWVGLNYYINW